MSMCREDLQNLIRDAVKAELSVKNRKKLVTSKELCKELDISLSTLNNWKAANKIPFKQLGKRIYYNLDEVVASMDEGRYTKLKDLKTFSAGG